MSQTFLKHDQPANTTVPILERMNFFKMLMKINDVINRDFLFFMIIQDQIAHVVRHR